MLRCEDVARLNSVALLRGRRHPLISCARIGNQSLSVKAPPSGGRSSGPGSCTLPSLRSRVMAKSCIPIMPGVGSAQAIGDYASVLSAPRLLADRFRAVGGAAGGRRPPVVIKTTPLALSSVGAFVPLTPPSGVRSREAAPQHSSAGPQPQHLRESHTPASAPPLARGASRRPRSHPRIRERSLPCRP